MKRKTAAPLIKELLTDYEERLAKDAKALLYNYSKYAGTECPLCNADYAEFPREADACRGCLKWPGAPQKGIEHCIRFIKRANLLKTRTAKLRWIARLRVALGEWVAEEAK